VWVGHSEEEDSEEEQQQAVMIPMPGQDLVSVGAMVVGTGMYGFQDGAAAGARFGTVFAMLCLPDKRVLVADMDNHRIRVLSADLQQVSTVAGDGGNGHRDGAAAQAQFHGPAGLALLTDGRVLVADYHNHRIRVLSADLQQVSTVGTVWRGRYGAYRDGAAAQALFNHPFGFALLTDGRVLVADQDNNCIRVLSADLQQVSTVAQAQFHIPSGLALLTDGRVLVADQLNDRIRVLSADLQQVSTVAGDGERGHRDGAAAQAQFHSPTRLALLPDGRVLVTGNNHIRVLSADLQQVSTLTNVGELNPSSFELLPDGRLLVSTSAKRIRVLEGFPAALLSTKPSHKRPKKTNQQQQKEKKRALAGGARSSGRLMPKRSRSGASSSSSSMAAPSSSDSEGEGRAY
jgi:hypothetical protein